MGMKTTLRFGVAVACVLGLFNYGGIAHAQSTQSVQSASNTNGGVFTVTPTVEQNIKPDPALVQQSAKVASEPADTSTTPPTTLLKLLSKGFSPVATTTPPAGTVNCFAYYTFGSVSVQLASRAGISPGQTATISAIISNNNPYPLVNGQLYVKIFRKQDNQSDFIQGGNIVDQFVAIDNVTLDAHQQKILNFSWTVPSNAVAGDYKIVPYFETDKRYNLLGLSFTDDVAGVPYEFTLKGASAEVSFDKNSILLNNIPYQVIAAAPIIASTTNPEIDVNLVNTTSKAVSVPIVWRVYYWDGLLDGHLLHTENQTVSVGPNASAKASYTVTDNDHSVYFVIAEADNGDSKSIVDVRFAKDGHPEARINFPSLTSFPIEQGTGTSIFSCLHSTSAQTIEGGKLVLTLTDLTDGSVIDTHEYDGQITGDMMGVADAFTPKKTYDKVMLTAALSVGGVPVESVSTTYDCSVIDPDKCTKNNGWSGSPIMLAVAFGVLVLLLAVTALIKHLWYTKK